VYVYTGALFSLAMGQVLNIAIYRAIGVNGVYYGVRLGNPVPWCKGFPFNVVSHPQYVGATLSFLGLSALLAYLIDPSAWYIAAFMAFCYICTGYIEDTY
jgi:methylene-fatty-acyl-phospholipid synthase